MVEGTPLLREHTPKKCIEGSNPSVSANGTKLVNPSNPSMQKGIGGRRSTLILGARQNATVAGP